jgi:hypothetical protein
MHAVWTSYSARAAAQLIGLPESSVRSLIRDGIVGAVGEVPARLSFRDLATLRVVKTVFEAGVPARRARRELAQLVRGLGGRALSEVALEVRAGRVWVRGQGPIVGQLELALEPVVSAPTPAGELHELPSRVEPPPAGGGRAAHRRRVGRARARARGQRHRGWPSTPTGAACACAPTRPRRGSTSGACMPSTTTRPPRATASAPR